MPKRETIRSHVNNARQGIALLIRDPRAELVVEELADVQARLEAIAGIVGEIRAAPSGFKRARLVDELV